MKTILIVMVGCALTVGAGCAPSKTLWISNPAVQTKGNSYYEAKIEPVKGEHDFYTSFNLWITNKTDKNMEIDWNRTQYIHNNKIHGVFVFKGIRPEDIKYSTVPPDIIPPRGSFSKVISPYKLIAWAPVRDRSKDSGIKPGIIPAGSNGILLVVRQSGKKIVQRMTIEIEKKVQ
jgi:hypothetical protein